jgi:DNA-binding NarL/FixJ family response regulator
VASCKLAVGARQGTIERMQELLGGDLPLRLRERVQCVRLLAMGRTGQDVAAITGRSVSTVERHKRRFLAEGE